MNAFTYSYPVKVYFGEKAAEKNLAAELNQYGENILLAYGGGSVKRNGIYDELTGILKSAGKNIIEFILAILLCIIGFIGGIVTIIDDAM